MWFGRFEKGFPIVNKTSTQRLGRALSQTSFKIVVKIKGCTDQCLYGVNLETLEKRAIKTLTAHEPGFASCQPDRIIIYKRAGRLEPWFIEGIKLYSELNEDQLEWRNKE